MSTLPHVHYRQNDENRRVTPGNRVNIDGDIRQHAEQLLRQSSMRRVPGKTNFQVAIAVAETTIDDFRKVGAPLEAAFVADVRDELQFMADEHAHAMQEFRALDEWHQAPVDPPEDLLPESVELPSAANADPAEDETPRHWRETYSTLTTMERRVLLAGVSCIGFVTTGVVYALASVLS